MTLELFVELCKLKYISQLARKFTEDFLSVGKWQPLSYVRIVTSDVTRGYPVQDKDLNLTLKDGCLGSA